MSFRIRHSATNIVPPAIEAHFGVHWQHFGAEPKPVIVGLRRRGDTDWTPVTFFQPAYANTLHRARLYSNYAFALVSYQGVEVEFATDAR